MTALTEHGLSDWDILGKGRTLTEQEAHDLAIAMRELLPMPTQWDIQDVMWLFGKERHE